MRCDSTSLLSVPPRLSLTRPPVLPSVCLSVFFSPSQAYADKHNFQYFETSAKTKINVDKAFTKLTQTVYATKSVPDTRQMDQSCTSERALLLRHPVDPQPSMLILRQRHF